jgi:hypothetical protein
MWEYLDPPSCAPSGFRVQISKQSDFSNIYQQGNVGAGIWSWTADPVDDCTAYYWRVRPKRSDGSLAPASQSLVWHFAFHTPRCL